MIQWICSLQTVPHPLVTVDFLAGVLYPLPKHAQPGVQTIEELQAALASATVDSWEDTLKTNVQAVYYTVVSFLPLLAAAAKKGEGRGGVVLTGSVAGIHWDHSVDNLNYQASKA